MGWTYAVRPSNSGPKVRDETIKSRQMKICGRPERTRSGGPVLVGLHGLKSAARAAQTLSNAVVNYPLEADVSGTISAAPGAVVIPRPWPRSRGLRLRSRAFSRATLVAG